MTKRELKRLRECCTAFRTGLLRRDKSKGRCYWVSCPLSGYLGWAGYDNKMVEGRVANHKMSHWWIELKCGVIVDATADQFRKPTGGKMPMVYVGPRPAWYRLESTFKK